MPSKEYIVLGNGLTLLDLPEDIFNLVVKRLGVGDFADRGSARDMACIARTCKKLRRDIAPYLYEKVYTRIGTTHDTSAIVRLVRQKPEIRPMIRTMVLDDFDHRHTRQLLSHEFPRLRRLLIQHVGDVPRSISVREKRYLNRSIRPQPMLNHLVFMIRCPGEPNKLAEAAMMPSPVKPYELTEDDVVLFIHPKLRYIRLSNLDFCAFEKRGAPAMQHEQLSILSLVENTKYTSKAFEQLVMPSTSLERMTLCETQGLPLTYGTYSPLLAHSATTLTHVKLSWMGFFRDPQDKEGVLDFGKFTALRWLAINPAYVLGRSLPKDGDEAIRSDAQLIVKRLPPNVEYLILERLVSPYPCLLQTVDTLFVEVLPHKAVILIQVLLEQKKALLPELKFLLVDCGHGDTSIPDWLCEIGNEVEVDLDLVNGFELNDEEGPAMSCLNK